VVGELKPEKDPALALATFERIRAIEPEAELRLVGDRRVTARAGVDDLVAGLLRQPPPGVTLAGHVPFGPRLFAEYADADVLLLASRSEGTPRVVTEARAFGCPVVACSVGGLPDVVVDGVDGLLVPGRDPARLAETVVRLWRDEVLRLRLVAAGLERARTDTVTAYASELLAEVDAALHGGRGVPTLEPMMPAAARQRPPAPAAGDRAAGSSCLSVLLPVHGAVPPDQFRRSVRSVLDQTLADLELLVLLDGLPADHGVRREALALAAADHRMVVLDRTKQRSIGAALNRLAERAGGDLLARMDADDLSHPDRLRRQVDHLRAHPEVDILGTWAREFEGDRVLYAKRLPVDDEHMRRFLVRRDPFVHPSVVLRRTAFERLGGYREHPRLHYLEDTDLWIRAVAEGLVLANLPEHLLYHRVSDDFYRRRRRGARSAATEARLRLAYRREQRLPWAADAYPIAGLIVRLLPTPAVRAAYRYGRDAGRTGPRIAPWRPDDLGELGDGVSGCRSSR
jgi:hypothetical protein